MSGTVTKQEVIKILEEQLAQTSNIPNNNLPPLYLSRLQNLLNKLKFGEYSEDVVSRELTSLGFFDLARKVRWGF